MRAIESFFFNDVVVKFAGAACRFHCIDVQPRANAAISHGRDQRRLIDNLATCGVDEIGAWTHRAEEICAKHVLRFGIEGQVNADNICRSGDSFGRLL